MSKIIPKTFELTGKMLQLAKPKITTFMYFAKVELIPPKPSEIPEIMRSIKKIKDGFTKGTWKQLTVKEGFLNTLVALEVYCWFSVGECIGKGSLVGYQV